MIIVQDSWRNKKVYDGTTRKFGVTLNNIDYIVKLAKDDLSAYCEYICSNIIFLLGVPAHEVSLAIYNNNVVALLKDFTINCSLHSFNDTRQSSEDTECSNKEYTYEDVLYLIDKHLKLTDTEKVNVKCRFWDMFICDAIIGNRDRHAGNWGYLNYNGTYKFAPLYDNGAGLFPDVLKVFNQYLNTSTRKQFLFDRVYTFPASLFKIKKSDRAYRTNYNEMFSDLRINKIFASEVRIFRSKFDKYTFFNLCKKIIIPINIDNNIKKFWLEILYLRYSCIVLRLDFDKEFSIVEEYLWRY